MALAIGVPPWAAQADDGWTGGREFSVVEPSAGKNTVATIDRSLVATLAPGSVLIAQTGGAPADPSPNEWQFTIAPYLWTPRTEIDLTVGNLSRSTTIDFADVFDDLNFAFATHFEANRGKWTLLLDVLYVKLDKEETTGPGVRTDLDYEQLFFEFGGTYRLATLPVGRAGRITFEALAGGRLMYVDAELSIGSQQRSQNSTLIDPMFGGRIAYHITDTVALSFRGDVGGFGISDSQSQLTYNIIAGLNWRFTQVASFFAGWRYMHIDIEKGSGASTLDADLSLNGPFLGFNFYF